MDEGESLEEGLADGKLTGGTAWMDESEDESLWSSDLNPEELQDAISDLQSSPDLLPELSYVKQENVNLQRFLDLADDENADLQSENKALRLQLESVRETLQHLENLGDDVEDVHGASAETDDTTQQKRFRKMEVENRALKAQCDGISSEMSSILSESEEKTVKIAQLMNRQQALEQQLEEYKISLDQSNQDLQEKSLIIECLQSPFEAYIAAIQELSLKNKNLEGQLEMAMMSGGPHVNQLMEEEHGQLPHSYVEKEEEREQEKSLDGIQEQSPVSGRAHVQTKSWWRRKAKGLRKVVRRMGTFCSCMRSNQVHPASDGMLPV